MGFQPPLTASRSASSVSVSPSAVRIVTASTPRVALGAGDRRTHVDVETRRSRPRPPPSRRSPASTIVDVRAGLRERDAASSPRGSWRTRPPASPGEDAEAIGVRARRRRPASRPGRSFPAKATGARARRSRATTSRARTCQSAIDVGLALVEHDVAVVVDARVAVVAASAGRAGETCSVHARGARRPGAPGRPCAAAAAAAAAPRGPRPDDQRVHVPVHVGRRAGADRLAWQGADARPAHRPHPVHHRHRRRRDGSARTRARSPR